MMFSPIAAMHYARFFFFAAMPPLLPPLATLLPCCRYAPMSAIMSD